MTNTCSSIIVGAELIGALKRCFHITSPLFGERANNSPNPVDTNTFLAPKATPPADVSDSASN